MNRWTGGPDRSGPRRITHVTCKACGKRLRLDHVPFRRRINGMWAWCVYLPRHERAFGVRCPADLQVMATAEPPSP